MSDTMSATGPATPSAFRLFGRDFCINAGAPAAWPAWSLAFALTCITVGIMWDISWHSTIGRDTFWTPAHMLIYLGGAMGGCVGGWLAIRDTFLSRGASNAAVSVFGARAPLGAWVAIWGAVAMLTSAPFDNWWHNAYGLDVKIISPPHTVLGLGMLGIALGALWMVLVRQNQRDDAAGRWLFVYAGGVFVALGSVFVMEFTFPNLQHTATFYLVCALTFPVRLVALGRAGRISWPATRTAIVDVLLVCLMMWILPLFPAQPRLAPIYNPVTHMVPPPFPLLLFVPAFGIDVCLARAGGVTGWRKLLLILVLGAVFVGLLLPTQWFFAKFLLSSAADNWFFGGDRYWSYGAGVGAWRHQFWHVNPSIPNASIFNGRAAIFSWILASLSAGLGLLWGNWMRRVRR